MKQKSNKTLPIIIAAIAILLILALLLSAYINSIHKQGNNDRAKVIKSYTSVSQFKSVEEVCIYLDCKYIKEEDSKEDGYKKDIYMNIAVEPYTENQSNEAFYNKLVSYIAEVAKYENFRIMDTSKNIEVSVVCDKDNKQIKAMYINGDTNYYARIESLKKLAEYKEIEETTLTIKSEIITELINNNWRILDSKIGTKESTFQDYSIFFDEGIELRRVNNKVFNIIFTQNYNKEVVEGIKTTTSKEDVIKKLGNPTFQDEETGLIGYKGKDIYLFIDESNKQISIYKNNKNEEDNIYEIYKECKEQDKTGREFIYYVKEKWTDYDFYVENENYILLQYTLKGVIIQFNFDSKNGVVVYNNYEGVVYEDKKIDGLLEIKDNIPEDIHVENEDLVYLKEKDRVIGSQNLILTALIQRDRSKKDGEVYSKLFVEYKEVLSDNSFNVVFISLDGNNPNSELKEDVDYGLWITDKIYVYSIKGKGIYAYNAVSGNYLTLTSGNNKNYEIKEFTNKTLIYDDNEQIKLNI